MPDTTASQHPVFELHNSSFKTYTRSLINVSHLREAATRGRKVDCLAILTRPVVPSTVSYVVRQQGNALSNAHGHRTHGHPTGTKTAREWCLYQHQVEMGLDGRYGEHRCTLDKRRKNEQAKDADRLGPKRHCSGNRGSSFPCHGHSTLPANREHLTRPCQPCGTWEARIAPFARKVGKL